MDPDGVTTHDWRGRPYMQVVDARDPLVVHLTFWTDGPFDRGGVPHEDDRLILRHSMQDHGARYVVLNQHKPLSEGDVHGLSARFEPRSQAEIHDDVKRFGARVPRPVVL